MRHPGGGEPGGNDAHEKGRPGDHGDVRGPYLARDEADEVDVAVQGRSPREMLEEFHDGGEIKGREHAEERPRERAEEAADDALRHEYPPDEAGTRAHRH